MIFLLTILLCFFGFLAAWFSPSEIASITGCQQRWAHESERHSPSDELSGCIVDLGLSPAQGFDYRIGFLKKGVEFQAIVCYSYFLRHPSPVFQRDNISKICPPGSYFWGGEKDRLIIAIDFPLMESKGRSYSSRQDSKIQNIFPFFKVGVPTVIY